VPGADPAASAPTACFRYREGRQWREVRSDDVNTYLKDTSGIDMSAKDFRTWHATVLAAPLLAEHDPDGTTVTRRRTVARVMREVAGWAVAA